jgi:hypothetical protein
MNNSFIEEYAEMAGIFILFSNNSHENEDDAREKLVNKMNKPIEEFKKCVEEFIAKGGNINGYCDAGNILQCAIIYKEYNGEVLDYLLSLPEINPFYTPKGAVESIVECLFSEKNEVSQEVIDKVLVVIDKRHNDYMSSLETFKTIMHNNAEKFASNESFNRMFSTVIEIFNTYNKLYTRIGDLRGAAFP